MYWNSTERSKSFGTLRWIVTLDVLKYEKNLNKLDFATGWIVTLDVLKLAIAGLLYFQQVSWIVTLDVLKLYRT